MKALLTLLTITAAATTLAVVPAQATFKGRNGRLVYQQQVGAHVQLFSARPDGSDPRQLTDFTDSDATNAVWSPDASKIAFTRRWGPNKQRLYTINADGSGLHALDPSLHLVTAWFPDGKHLLVFKKLQLTIVTAGGTAPRDADMPIKGDSPCILPDGQRVAMLASLGRSDGKEAIFVARMGGGAAGAERITPWQKMGDKIDCSPDGTKIVFTTPDFGPPQSGNVYVIGVDGTGLHQLTHSTGGKINNGANSWSPDGRKISFVSNRDGTYQIYTMNADGTGVTKVTDGGESHRSSWGTHP